MYVVKIRIVLHFIQFIYIFVLNLTILCIPGTKQNDRKKGYKNRIYSSNQ